MSSDDLVLTERAGDAVAIVTLNRPDKKNALSIALRDGVVDELTKLAHDEGTKAVVLCGAGGAFSAGFDLEEFARALEEPGLYEKIWASGDPYHALLLTYPLPLIAAVDGVALGGGMDTAVLCDMRIASTRARFGHPEAAFGDVVYAPLRNLIGASAANDLCLTGRIIDAAEAKTMGLVSEITEPERLLERATELAAMIARAPRDLVMRTKSKIIACADIPFTRTLDL